MIVCLGWGSLIWDHRDLPIGGDWRNDGPGLPVEFARQSRDGRITLVVAQDSDPVSVFWARLDVPSLDDARIALARREGISSAYLDASVGYWSQASQSRHGDAPAIGEWAENIEASAVVWTALKPRFRDMSVKPSCDEVVTYLSGLTGDAQERAEEYVRRTPGQIRTRYRDAIERELGWTEQESGPLS